MDAEDRRAHLTLILDVITRLATGSRMAKQWLLPVISAAYGYALVQASEPVALLGVAAAALFCFLDAGYLRQERAYRQLYADVIGDDAARRPGVFDLNVSGYLSGTTAAPACSWRSVMVSWSVAGFYAPIALVGVLIAVM